MQVLIVDDNITRQTELSSAFTWAGFQPSTTDSHSVAERCIRRGWFDLLVMSERVGGRLTHQHALLAEWRNPMVATILLTPRHDVDTDELFLLLPSLHCLLAPDTDADLITQLSIASVIGAASRSLPLVLTADQMIDELVDAVPIFASTRMPSPAFEHMRRQA